jgi:hypothetical protein
MAELRAVKPGDKAPEKLTVAQAAATGDRYKTLVATRDRVAMAISDPKCSPRDLAALTKRLDDIIEKIKTIEEAGAHDDDGHEAPADSFDASAI